MLETQWIEIFRSGNYGERGRYTDADVERIAAAYNPRLHRAPVTVGHPEHDRPAYAWVDALRARRNGHAVLEAKLADVAPEFEQLVRAGRFRERSVALYTSFPQTGGPYLRHLAFLGAQPPEVKGLKPIQLHEFAANGSYVEIGCPIVARRVEFNEPRNPASVDRESVALAEAAQAVADELAPLFPDKPQHRIYGEVLRILQRALR